MSQPIISSKGATMPSSFPAEAVPLLLDWYHHARRDLPWRENRDPYRVLVSEIMLQQTRAETVKPYFHRFLQTLPHVEDLAAAPEATLLKLWEGLGYYSRVRNLQKAAQTVMEKHGGVIPADFEALLALPGVGRYTAGAVASIAFDIPVPAVDGNVLRVLARLLGDDRDVLSPAAKSAAEAALAPHVPSPGAGDFTQGLIELGALVCLPGQQAKCHECPLQLLCEAKRQGRVDELPVRLPKTRRRVEERTVLVIRYDPTEATDRSAVPEPLIALCKRPDQGLLAGLYEFPCLDGFVDESAIRAYLTDVGLKVATVQRLPDARHLFSHIEWRMQGHAVTLAAPPPADLLFSFVPLSQVDTKYAIPSAYKAYRNHLFPGT